MADISHVVPSPNTGEPDQLLGAKEIVFQLRIAVDYPIRSTVD